jgi:hypothetical protein
MSTRILRRGQVRNFIDVPDIEITPPPDPPDTTSEDCMNQILEHIRNTPLANDEYMLIEIEYTDETSTNIVLNNSNRKDLLKDFIDLKEILEDSDFEPVGEESDKLAEIWRKAKEISFCDFTIKKYHNIEASRRQIEANEKGEKRAKTTRRKPRHSGAFFKHYHIIENKYVTELLAEYLVFSKPHISNRKANQPYGKCIVEALKGQVSEATIRIMADPQEGIKTDFYPMDGLETLAKKYKIGLKLIYLSQQGKRKSIVYNVKKHNEDDKIPTICLIDGHYFRYDQCTNITKYYLQNFQTVPKCSGEYKINKIKENGLPQFCRIWQHFLDSFDLVRYLLKFDLTTPIDIESLLEHPEAPSRENAVIRELDIEEHSIPFEWDSLSRKNLEHFLIMDFEAYTHRNNNGRIVQKPFMLGVYGEVKTGRQESKIIDEVFTIQETPIKNPEERTLDELGERMIKECFNHIASMNVRTDKDNPLVIFCHNLTYDIQFILNHPCVWNPKPLINNNRMVSFQCDFVTYSKVKLRLLFKDSLRILANSCADLPEMFELKNIKKEVVFYELFKEELMRDFTSIPMINIKDIVNEHIENANNRDKAIKRSTQFFKNLMEHNCIQAFEKCNLTHYVKYYCRQDCKVVYDAMIEFNKLIKDINGKIPDIWNFYSLPSLAHAHFYLNGCYDKCNQFSGLLGSYFDQFVIGGRCMLANNKPLTRKGRIQDFDAVSLYPSAMHFFDGFIQGSPKPIPTGVDIAELTDRYLADYYFVRVKILEIGKERPFPVISYVDEDGGREWDNKKIIGKTIPLDKVGLEDAIEFMEIKYEIVDGYYFNEGFNRTINKEIKSIFNERKKAKAEGKGPKQKTLKLKMNSSYGKTIQKPNNNDTKMIVGHDKMVEMLARNCNFITKVDSIGIDKRDDQQKYIYKLHKPLVESMSLPHIGTQILSYSKRIMNRVMCLADDIGVEIFYQDTDSMHLFEEDVEKISKAYNDKYSRELVGSDLGQFHCDFDSDRLKDIYSELFIGVGKKMYMDRLVGVIKKKKTPYGERDEDQEEQLDIGEIGRDYHIRMKGIPLYAVDHHCVNNKVTYESVYESLLDDLAIDFDLLVDNRVSFEKFKDFSHSNREEFTRRITINEELRN